MSWGVKIGPTGPQRSANSEGGGGVLKGKVEYPKEALDDISQIEKLITDNKLSRDSYHIRELNNHLKKKSSRSLPLNEENVKVGKLALLEFSANKRIFAISRMELAKSLKDPVEGFSAESNRKLMSPVTDGETVPYNAVKKSEQAAERALGVAEAATAAAELLDKLKTYEGIVGKGYNLSVDKF